MVSVAGKQASESEVAGNVCSDRFGEVFAAEGGDGDVLLGLLVDAVDWAVDTEGHLLPLELHILVPLHLHDLLHRHEFVLLQHHLYQVPFTSNLLLPPRYVLTQEVTLLVRQSVYSELVPFLVRLDENKHILQRFHFFVPHMHLQF